MSSASDTKLPERAEAMLASFPLAERSEEAWEAMAVSIIDRAKASTDAVSEELLRAPLPATEGEDGFERKETSPVKAAAPVSLADLARASVKKKNDADKNIALESMAVASQARAQVDEIAERVQAATRQARTSRPDPSELKAAAPTEATPAAQAPAAEVAPASAQQQQQRASVSRGPWLVSGIAVLAAAAAIAISFKPNAEPPPLVSTQLPQAAQPGASPTAPAAQPEIGRAGRPPEGAQEDGSQKIAELPPAERSAPAAAPLAVAKGGAPAPSAAPSGVRPEQIVLEDEEPAAEPAAPVVGAQPSAKMVPAELPRGGLPDKPSAGAAYAAIGPFMGPARACVAGHDDASTARISFSSDGSVQNVTVSGPAAGTSAASCIQNAFKKARVQPFAAPSFSMSTTVRPQ